MYTRIVVTSIMCLCIFLFELMDKTQVENGGSMLYLTDEILNGNRRGYFSKNGVPPPSRKHTKLYKNGI